MSKSRQYWGRILTLLLVAITGIVAWAFWQRQRNSTDGRGAEESAATTSAKQRTDTDGDFALRTEAIRERFIRAAHMLKSPLNPEETRRIFTELHGLLSGMSREAASALIHAFLDSGVDAPSQLDFSIGSDGFLKQPSSLRVFLLDQLAQLDRAAAAVYAEKILNSFSSADEWAVSLRNYALGNTNAESRAFLQGKFREMIRHEPWQTSPSVGFLEAFDVAVHTRGTELMPDLAELTRQKENKAVAHAAYLTLDRLAIQEPVAVLQRLQAEPGLMQGREQTRANFFARADLGDTEQRQVVERYLLDPARQNEELQTFAGVFPNANFMVSHNLLTRNVTPDGTTLARRDRDALRTVGEWMTDPRFAHLKPQLLQIEQRLLEFKRQAEASR
jgi:hypothetical protein